MNPLHNNYSNSLRQSGDEDIARLRALVAQLIAEKAQASIISERPDQHVISLIK